MSDSKVTFLDFFFHFKIPRAGSERSHSTVRPPSRGRAGPERAGRLKATSYRRRASFTSILHERTLLFYAPANFTFTFALCCTPYVNQHNATPRDVQTITEPATRALSTSIHPQLINCAHWARIWSVFCPIHRNVNFIRFSAGGAGLFSSLPTLRRGSRISLREGQLCGTTSVVVRFVSDLYSQGMELTFGFFVSREI